MRSFRHVFALGSFLAAGTAFAMAENVSAFYDFSEGTPGADVVTVVNRGSLGAAYNGTGSFAEGGAVRFSDDVPGRYLYADQTSSEPLSTNWKSISFTVSGSNGGLVTIPGLGEKICASAVANGCFTIEFFAKAAPDVQNWKDFVKFYYHSESLVNQLAKYVYWNNGRFGLQMSSSNPRQSDSVSVDRWYHLAAVYTKEGDAVGVWKMYCDGKLFATQEGTVLGASTSGDFLLGGSATNFENLSGKIAALRVTESALEPREFMRFGAVDAERQQELDGVLGLWTFAEGTVDAPVASAPNAIDPQDRLLGYSLGTGGTLPTYSDDVPGAKLLSSAVNGKVISTDFKSVKFDGDSTSSVGGKLTLPRLASRLTFSGAGTLEFFCKLDADYAWRSFFGMSVSSGRSFKISNRSTVDSIVVQYYAESSPEYPRSVNPSLRDWHHVAFAWDAESRRIDYYVDYQLFWSQTDADFTLDGSDGFFGCNRSGNNGETLNGKICAIRLMPRRLAPQEMMAVSHATDPSVFDADTVFHWSFEEPWATEGAPLSTVESASRDVGAFIGVASYRTSQMPTYSRDVSQPTATCVVQPTATDPVRLASSRYCARFYGYSPLYNDMWAGSHLEQRVVLEGVDSRPESFTLEMFIRRDLTAWINGANGMQIAAFSKSGIDVQTEEADWWLVTKGSGNAEVQFIYRDPADGDSHWVDTGISLEDGAWHHLAMTYDATTRTIAFYLDYQEVHNAHLADGMRCTKDQGWRHVFGRGTNTSGFNGWMDDIRLSRTVRPVGQFLQKSAQGFILLFR